MKKYVVYTALSAVLLGVFFPASSVENFGPDIFGFASPQWQVIPAGTVNVTFASVEGNENAKEDLRDIVNFLKNPTVYKEMGAVIPKGVLLEGPAGTGKTLLARALAGEAHCNFVSVSGAQFVEMYVGVGAARVRSLFDTVRSLNAPCIIFIDEIDALLRKRGSSPYSQESDMTLNEMLKQMDGFEQYEHPIIVIGATNRVDILDAAAIRPGRFDRIVYVGLPTVLDREKILALHIRTRKHAHNLNLKPIAERTSGLAGADLANLINEAAIIAINKGKKYIEQRELEEALDKIVMGKPNKNMIISDKEKEVTAYHEAGHALLHVLLNPENRTLHKVSIIPRGSSGGHTAFLPKEQMYMTKQEFLNRIITCFGGRAAEYIMFNATMTGPSADIKAATHLARSMICTYGMSDAIGPVAYEYNPEYTIAPYAQSTLGAIDAEVRTLLEQCYRQAVALITEHKQKLDALATALIGKEELSAEEVYEIMQS